MLKRLRKHITFIVTFFSDRRMHKSSTKIVASAAMTEQAALQQKLCQGTCCSSHLVLIQYTDEETSELTTLAYLSLFENLVLKSDVANFVRR